jgi:hypothetical protein
MAVQAKNITRAEGLTRTDVYAKANAAAADHMPHGDGREDTAMAASCLDPAAAKYTVADLETVTVNAVRAVLQQYAIYSASPTKAPGKWTAQAQSVYC